MLIEYVKGGKIVNLKDKTASVLIKAGLARPVVETRQAEPEISPRTGQPKRVYRRRDMTAEG